MPASVSQWAPMFEDAAERHGVDPALLSIMALIESRGNPEAVSSSGAVGVMQIMPKTAEAIARARGLKIFDLDQLRDPATNIDMAAWFLAKQIATFGDGRMSDATIALAAAAHNGGPSRMRKHLAEGTSLSRESIRYSDLVGALWRDRESAQSEVFDQKFGRPR